MDALKCDLSVKKLCRICLVENQILTDIYTVLAALNGPISNALQKCAPIHINKGDDLPDCICDSCLGQLLKSYQFQVLAVESEKILYQRLKKSQPSEIYNDLKIKSEPLQSSESEDELNNLSAAIKVEINLEKPDENSHESVDNNHYLPKKIEEKYKIDEKSAECLPRTFSEQCTENSNKVLQNTKTQQKAGEKLFQCELCNKRFTRMYVLKVHMKLHNGVPLHQCDVCGKCFEEVGALNIHKRKHTGENPYQCDVCENKWFSRKSTLDRHKLQHTGVKPYLCDVCNKCFSQKINLTTHKRQHTGEKPYQCDVCNKRFSRHDNLTRHKRKQTCV